MTSPTERVGRPAPDADEDCDDTIDTDTETSGAPERADAAAPDGANGNGNGRPGRDAAAAGPRPPVDPPADRARTGRWDRWWTIGLPAAIAYIPLLLTHPGMVGADTKTYLYLDPIKLLSGAPYVWDSQIGLGTVTHQNIGYLFPSGPFYLILSELRFIPDWVAQRLWLGTLLFVAGMGLRYLLGMLAEAPVAGNDRATRRRPVFGVPAVLAATLAYMLSPYLLDYSARISVILLPWCALPWLVALAAKSVRHGGWRYPAWFAFGVLAVGGMNFTALLMMGFGPLLWVLHAVFVEREVTFRQAAAAVGRIAVLSLATALWWIAGLLAEGRYGLPVLRYTESYKTVADSSSAPELLRGLGYWFFYGKDKLGPWIEPSVMYTEWVWLLALSYLLPVLALVTAALVRWRYRTYFIATIVVGTLIGVAGHPWDASPLLGGVFKAWTRTDFGLGLRSTPRAAPLIVMGTAVFLGVGVEALGRRIPRLALPAGIAVCLLVAANIPPMWTNQMVASNLERAEEIPSWWQEDAEHLQSRGEDTRVLEVPGADFASYRWGNTVDPVLPGMMSRGYVARELFQWGSPPSANLVNALDRRLHEETMDPEALAPVARLLAVGDVNVRSDMQFERYRVARPRQLWDLIRRAPGLGEPVPFGPTDPPNRAGPLYTMIDEVELGTPASLPEPPRVAAVPVQDPRPMLRTESASRPMLMAGDGEGVVDAAAVGLVNADQPIFYSGDVVGDPTAWQRTYERGADLVVTDSNRRRGRRWGALRENTGYTERPGETFDFDPTDQRLDLFPGAPEETFTVSNQRAVTPRMVGGEATATSYGNPITFTPDDRPANAFDGDPLTAWRTGALGRVADQRLDLRLEAPVTTDHLTLLQPVTLDRSRWLTAVRLTFTAPDGSTSTEDVRLDDSSRDERARDEPGLGQVVTFPARTFTKLAIGVADTNEGLREGRGGLSGVGFAEVAIPGVEVVETIRPPLDLLAEAGASSQDHRLTYLFSRQRSNPAEPVRGDEEPAMRRLLRVPTARSFGVSGQARISGQVDVDPVTGDRRNNAVDRLVGQRDHTAGGVTVTSDGHLAGSVRSRGSAAVDGDPTTAWTTPYLRQVGRWLDVRTASPVTFDHLDLQVVNDGRHSVPTHLRLTVDGVDQGVLALPRTEPQAAADAKVPMRVDLPTPVTGSSLRFIVEAVDERRTDDWYADGALITMPVAIAEIGVPGVRMDAPPATFDSGCRSDLLEIDGRPVPLRVSGPMEDAIARRSLAVEGCVPAGAATPEASGVPGAVRLDPGDHLVRTGLGTDPDIAIDVDRLLFSSDRGGAALAPDALATSAPPGPAATDVSFARVDGHMRVERADEPFWLVLGQSSSSGWSATANGHDLGAPVVINGYGNGWYLDPAVVGAGPLDIDVTWSPQRLVWIFIGVSLVAGVITLVLMIRRPRRRREMTPVPPSVLRPVVPSFPLGSRAEANPAAARPVHGLPADGQVRRLPADGQVRRLPADGQVRRLPAAVAAIAVGVFTALNLPTEHALPALGLLVGGALYGALRFRRGRWGWLLGLAGAGSLALTAAYIVGRQWRRGIDSDFGWPGQFERVHFLGVLAVCFLAADAVRELVTDRSARPADDATAAADPQADPGPDPDPSPVPAN